MAIDIYDSVEARLTAYIAPNVPSTNAQKQAFELAVEAQAEYEKEMSAIPAGMESFKLGDFSAEVKSPAAYAEYTQDTLHPYAWALLYNAGLLRKGAIPTARRR